MYTVYMHEHIESGKKYIGITSRNVCDRWGCGKGYKRTSRFRSAVDKYGWDAFRHEVLHTDLTYEDACRLEKELIAKHRTTEREFGYNNSIGGEKGALGNHHKLSEDTKHKMSKAKSGVPRPKWKEGRKVSENSLEKLQELNRKRGKMVVCIETGAEYNGLREASRLTGINISNICHVCNGSPKYSYAGKLPDGTKLHWRYKDETQLHN